MEISFDNFVKTYGPIRNTHVICSPIENMMFENSDPDQMEIVDSKTNTNIWTVTDSGLYNGRKDSYATIGYLICKEKCDLKRGEVKVNI